MRKPVRLIAALFLLAAPPAMAQETTGFPSLEDMQRMVAQMRERMYAPGAVLPGWNRGGANPDAELRRAGADRFYYRLSKTGGDAVVILTSRSLASFVPEGWRVVDTYGDSSAAAENPVLQFEAMSARYVVGLRAASTRRDDVDCIDGITNAVLYERPDATATAEDDVLPLLFRLSLLATEGQTVCTRYEGNREAGWRGRAFTSDGHALPEFDDADERITIVPAVPIDRLITFRPRPAEGAPAT